MKIRLEEERERSIFLFYDFLTHKNGIFHQPNRKYKKQKQQQHKTSGQFFTFPIYSLVEYSLEHAT